MFCCMVKDNCRKDNTLWSFLGEKRNHLKEKVDQRPSYYINDRKTMNELKRDPTVSSKRNISINTYSILDSALCLIE